ncbi:hypothetical protein PMIN06_008784 [Paraphaeosphaeria minitans]|uniref:Uncharacterized protein n=1 Tax=Paraphaeosphaeria minitans TaxID=565426 RepID=A0A9P6G7Q9_9PLEO|nr:hypothetical protein PMIN01_11278 [Paraphaeosphaeria minitans]
MRPIISIAIPTTTNFRAPRACPSNSGAVFLPNITYNSTIFKPKSSTNLPSTEQRKIGDEHTHRGNMDHQPQLCRMQSGRGHGNGSFD